MGVKPLALGGGAILMLYLINVMSTLTLASPPDPAYKISLQREPIGVVPEGEGLEVVTLSTKFGQRYTCTYRGTTDVKEETIDPTKINVDILLTTYYHGGECLIYSAGWWTYKLCPFQDLLQYREENGQILGVKYLLGTYSSQYNWTLSKPTDPQVVEPYHSIYYVNGTECDLTGLFRKTEVRMYCRDENIYSPAVILIDETRTCEYTIIMHVPQFCKHKMFRSRVEKSAPQPIECKPLLTPEQLIVYKEKEALEQSERDQKHEENLKIMKRLRQMASGLKPYVREMSTSDDFLAEAESLLAETEAYILMSRQNSDNIQAFKRERKLSFTMFNLMLLQIKVMDAVKTRRKRTRDEDKRHLFLSQWRRFSKFIDDRPFLPSLASLTPEERVKWDKERLGLIDMAEYTEGAGLIREMKKHLREIGHWAGNNNEIIEVKLIHGSDSREIMNNSPQAAQMLIHNFVETMFTADDSQKATSAEHKQMADNYMFKGFEGLPWGDVMDEMNEELVAEAPGVAEEPGSYGGKTDTTSEPSGDEVTNGEL